MAWQSVGGTGRWGRREPGLLHLFLVRFRNMGGGGGGLGSCCVIPYTRHPEFNFSKRICVLRTPQGPYCHVARP